MNRRDFLQGAVAAVGSLGALPSGAADPVVAKGVAKGAEAKGAEALAQIWRREGGVFGGDRRRHARGEGRIRRHHFRMR